jgi:translocation and assembly module TamB
MNSPNSPNQLNQTGKATSERSSRRHALRLIILLLSVTALLALLLTAAVWTEIGTRTLLRGVQSASGGALEISGISGKLAGQLQLDELSYRSKKTKLLASGVQLSWAIRSLFIGKIDIDDLQIVSLKIANLADPAPAQLPLDLRIPLALSLNQAAIGRLSVATLQTDGTEVPVLQLTALTAKLDSNQVRHQMNLNLTTPWGKTELHGTIASVRPFALRAQFSYQGQVDPAIPNMGVEGTLGGSLMALSIQAKAISTQQVGASSNVMRGGLNAVVTAFSPQILRSLQADIAGVNPAAFRAGAPIANLHISANVHADTTKKQTQYGSALIGSVEIQNSQPGRLDQNRLPFQLVRSDVLWSGQQVMFNATQLLLPGNGKVIGAAAITLPKSGVPIVQSHFALSSIDLKQIHNGMKASRISGTLDVQTDKEKVLNFQTLLLEPRASLKVNANYLLDPDKNTSAVLKVTRVELLSEKSRLSGNGEIAFLGQKNFNFQGELRQFDPSRWLAGPAGQIDAELSLRGQLAPKLVLNARLPHLKGRYAGQPLSGQVDLDWGDGALLLVRKLELALGRSTLSGHGTWGNRQDELLLKLEAPDLSAFSSLLQTNLTGSINAEAHLRGNISEPAGQVRLNAKNIGVEKQWRLDQLSADISLEKGWDGALTADILLQNVRAKFSSDAKASTVAIEPKGDAKLAKLVEQLRLTVKGTRDVHTIDVNAKISPSRQLILQASGGLQSKVGGVPNWSGSIGQLSLSGSQDVLLSEPMRLDANAQSVRVGNVHLSGPLGKLSVDQFEWSPDAIKTRGKASDLRLLDIVNLIKPQLALEGDLQIDANWDVELKDKARGEIHLQRKSGDVSIADADGTGLAVPLGMTDLKMDIVTGGLIAGTDAQRIRMELNAAGSRLGIWRAQLDSRLQKQANQWRLDPLAPLEGSVHADIPDLQWIGPRLSPGLALKGKLLVDAKLAGSIGKPRYQAQIEGRELEVAFASEGLLLPNGSLSAQMDEERIKLTTLQFSNTVTLMPRHARFRDLDWVGQKGQFSASGEIDWLRQSGDIHAEWTKFPLLQRKDRWLVMSGEANIKQSNKVWALTGKMVADGGYFRLPKLAPPSLSSDVVVIRANGKNEATDKNLEKGKSVLKTSVDVTLEMGPQFVFVGRGLDTSLDGTIRLRGSDGAPLQATGSINTVGGLYEGYGQQLEIERGILNFQGPPGNPGLNIRALRKGLPVEAGVDVVGTVGAPQVRLVSDPDVPDAEKISWLVLGRGIDQASGNDASLLLSAAGAIFGGDGSQNIPKDVVNGLGFDEFSIGAVGAGGSSKMPSQTIAGATGVGSSSVDHVVSVGKRIAPGLVLSVERGLSDASGAVKLSWQLTRRISIIGRTGNDSSVDANYTFSFK